MLDESASRRFGEFRVGDHREFSGHRLEIVGKTRGARSFTTSPIAFLDYGLAQELAPDELSDRTTFIVAKLAPGADAEAVADEIRRRLPYNDVYTERTPGPPRRAAYWIESTGLGLTIFLTVSLGGLVGVVIVAQTLYASVSEHLPEFGTVKALGGRDIDVYGIIAEQAAFAAALGFGLGVVLTIALEPVLAGLDMAMVVTPTLCALVFSGTLALCLAASTLSFRKVARIDPAIVFRG